MMNTSLLGVVLALSLPMAASAAPPTATIDPDNPRAEVDLDGDGSTEILEMVTEDGQGKLRLRFVLKPSADDSGQILLVHVEEEPWAYGMKVRDLDADGRPDLEFWTGTDIGNEVIWLLNEGDTFLVLELGFIRDVHDYTPLFPFREGPPADEAQGVPADEPAVARWDAQKRTFEGLTVRWISGDRVALRASPNREAAEVMRLPGGTLVHYLGIGPTEAIDGEPHPWVHVRWDDEIEGWIWGRHVSNTVPVGRTPGD